LGWRRKKKTQKIGLEHGHHAALYLFIFDIGILKFQKIIEKCMWM
jgi:hypothetical protein